MKSIGIIFNIRKMFVYFIFLIIGLSLMSYGVITYYEDRRAFDASLSDEEVIERAKSLGFVELKDQIPSNNISSEKSEETTTATINIESTETIDDSETIDTTEGE